VNDTTFVCIPECVGNLHCNLKALGVGQIFAHLLQAAQMLAQTATADIFHRDKQSFVGIAKIINTDDRSMVKLSSRLRFLNEASAKGAAAGEMSVHQFERNHAV